MALHQFLLVYNAATQTLLEANDLGPDTDRAIAAYAECEERHRGDRDIQVVLIGSDSIETIEHTQPLLRHDQPSRVFRDDGRVLADRCTSPSHSRIDRGRLLSYWNRSHSRQAAGYSVRCH